MSLVMVMIKHSQSTQSDKFVISLQYLEKEVRNGVHFLPAGKQQSFNNLALMFLIKVARHVKSTKDRTLIIFFQYIKKKVSKLLFRSIVMLQGPVMFVITCCLNHDILIGRYSVHCNDKNYLLVIILHQASKAALRKKCPYSELFWSVFFRIRTEYGEIIRISPC